jgi:hypothetical protein
MVLRSKTSPTPIENLSDAELVDETMRIYAMPKVGAPTPPLDDETRKRLRRALEIAEMIGQR